MNTKSNFFLIFIKNKVMKNLLLQKVIKPIAQAYANYLIFMLDINIKTGMGGLDMYEQLMTNAVTLDYVCSEELGIEIN